MRRTLGVGIVLLLLLSLSPDGLFAQATSGGRSSRLKGNYPNPFNPTTTIPFTLLDEDLRDGKPAKVTIRIYNLLSQLVAIPRALQHPAGNGVLVDNLMYTEPGEKLAFWDGTDSTGRKVASGIYYVVLIVNGEREPPKKMVVNK